MDLMKHPTRTANRLLHIAAFALTALTGLAAVAQTTTPSPSPGAVVTLEPVAVSGVLPGPALWKVSKNNHVMWVLGTTSPLPKGMQWESSKVERLVAASQQVLKPPRVGVGARVGFWGKIGLIPSMIGLKKIPDGGTLQQVLLPDLYSRWLAQKTKYLSGQSADRLRPMFAGKELYGAAIKRAGLTEDTVAEDAVYTAAKRHKVQVSDTSYVLVLDDPRSAAKQFKKVTLDDQQCLRSVIDAIDQDLAQATIRANAWATGDIQTLSKLLSTEQQDECLSTLGSTDFAKKIGMTDISNRIKQAWVKAAKNALSKNTQVVALLPMDHILGGDGYLETLRADGYIVHAPTQLSDANTDGQ